VKQPRKPQTTLRYLKNKNNIIMMDGRWKQPIIASIVKNPTTASKNHTDRPVNNKIEVVTRSEK
jgi:hypothetical protein